MLRRPQRHKHHQSKSNNKNYNGRRLIIVVTCTFFAGIWITSNRSASDQIGRALLTNSMLVQKEKESTNAFSSLSTGRMRPIDSNRRIPTTTTSNNNIQSTIETMSAAAKTTAIVPSKLTIESQKPGFCRTSSSGYEIIMESLLGSFFQQINFIPEGNVLDVGAQFGEQACHFALLAPNRIIYALDPSPKQVNEIQTKFGTHLPNLKVMNAGIGQYIGNTTVNGPGFTGLQMGDTYQVETIDHLFYDQNNKLGFAHIDVEGLELDVIKGGKQTIQQDQPIFTTEVRVHQNPNYTMALLNYINELGYDSYVVDEPCGWPHMDYRNLINFPRTFVPNLEHSDVFNLAISTDAIFQINSKTIFEKIYPCCTLGGECCPYESTNHKDCCHEKIMIKWHEEHGKKPLAMQGFTYSKRHVHSTWKNLRSREHLTPEQAVAS